MTKSNRGRCGIALRQCRPTPYPMPSYDESEDTLHKNCSKIFEKKDWEDATCSVCMEYPHNAVLLLCSSHEKGCRPYMCGTSFRYSNCLDQYKKASTKVTSSMSNPLRDSAANQAMDTLARARWSIDTMEPTELACPLCRGQVKGWTVLEPAREHLNSKKRSCMQDNCSFSGTYKELRKHVKEGHPSAKPREVDPTLEQKWRRLERDREREDTMSTIRSSTPGAVFFGDYVIERNYGLNSDDEDGLDEDLQNDGIEIDDGVERSLMPVLLFLQAFGSSANMGLERGIMRNERDSDGNLYRGSLRWGREGSRGAFDFSEREDADAEDHNNDSNYSTSLSNRLRSQGRVLLGRSGRRRRRRESNSEGR